MIALTTTLAGLAILGAEVNPNSSAPEPVKGEQVVKEAEGYRSSKTQSSEKPLGMRLPVATRMALDFIPVPIISLAELDHVDLILEGDEMLKEGRPLRYGVKRTLEVNEQDGQWVAVPGGQIWQIEIHSEGAENIIVSMENMNLPEGCELRTYVPGSPETVNGPFTDNGPRDSGRIDSLIEPVNRIVVEYYQPATVDAAGLPFDITELIHGYLPILKDGLAGGSGNCHNHASCYSEWSDVGDATALIAFGGFICSGQLIATTAQDEQPYFSTAYHCISTQSEASSTQFIFKYERTSCNGSYSNGASTSGSTLTATHGTSDNTLLRINGSLPSNTFWVGWTTDVATSNLDVVGIHHPSGDYMRLSFGDVNSNPVCGSSTYWFGVRWNDGVTEGGSSGSGAYRVSDQKLMGVLTCGASSCSNTSGLDGYGRFQRAYDAGFDDYLVNGTPDDDQYEENDTCATASFLTSETLLSDMVVKSKDEDWYRLNLDAGYTVNFDLDFAHSNGDIDVELYSISCTGNLEDTGTSNTNDESVSWSNTESTGKRVYIRVFLDSGSENDYDLSISYNENPDPVGACCANGFCSVVLESNCIAVSGVWEGPNTDCSDDPCVDANGACCINNECYQLTAEFCGLASGEYLGDNTPCETGTCALECPADLNNDGIVDGIDLAEILGNWGQATSDLTGDGIVDGQDLAVILGFWGPC
jgi:hypothetical protein